jgi:hypothetical protein
MIFTKNKGMFCVAVFIILAVFNVIVFVIPFNKGAGFWIGYSFSMLAILLAAAVSLYTFDKKTLKSKVYEIPLILLAWRYLVIQLVVGFLEILLDFIPVPFQYGIVINTILLGVCLIGLIAVDAAKEAIEQIDEKIKQKIFYINRYKLMLKV